ELRPRRGGSVDAGRGLPRRRPLGSAQPEAVAAVSQERRRPAAAGRATTTVPLVRSGADGGAPPLPEGKRRPDLSPAQICVAKTMLCHHIVAGQPEFGTGRSGDVEKCATPMKCWG